MKYAGEQINRINAYFDKEKLDVHKDFYYSHPIIDYLERINPCGEVPLGSPFTPENFVSEKLIKKEKTMNYRVTFFRVKLRQVM
jgi:hypothetical protein